MTSLSRTFDRLAAGAFLLFAVASPITVSVGSIAAGLLAAVGIVRGVGNGSVRSAVPRSVWITLAAWIAWTGVATALAAPHPVRFDVWADELWIKLLVPLVAMAAVGRAGVVDAALRTYLTLGALIGLMGAYQHQTGDQWFRDAWITGVGDHWRAVGFFGHHLTYAGYAACVFLLAVARLITAPGRRTRARIESVATAVLVGLGLALSYARSAQLGVIGALPVMAVLQGGRARRPWMVAIGVVVLTVALLPGTRTRVERLADLQTEGTRVQLWRTSAAAIQDRPWTGYGPGNFASVLRDHEVEGVYRSRAHAHNDLIMQAVNAGPIGAILFLAFQVAVIVALARRARAGGPQAWIALGAAGAVVALTLGGAFQVFQTDDEVELALYFLVGCGLAVPPNDQPRIDRTT